MKKIHFLILLSFYVCTMYGQNLSNITIRVSNVELNGSKVFVALYDNEDSFSQKLGTVDSVKIIPETETIDVIFNNIPNGHYAVAVFQDLNNNNSLDKTGFSIPLEPVGISNYATNKILGRPTFKKAQLYVTADTVILIPLAFKRKGKHPVKE